MSPSARPSKARRARAAMDAMLAEYERRARREVETWTFEDGPVAPVETGHEPAVSVIAKEGS